MTENTVPPEPLTSSADEANGSLSNVVGGANSARLPSVDNALRKWTHISHRKLAAFKSVTPVEQTKSATFSMPVPNSPALPGYIFVEYKSVGTQTRKIYHGSSTVAEFKSVGCQTNIVERKTLSKQPSTIGSIFEARVQQIGQHTTSLRNFSGNHSSPSSPTLTLVGTGNAEDQHVEPEHSEGIEQSIQDKESANEDQQYASQSQSTGDMQSTTHEQTANTSADYKQDIGQGKPLGNKQYSGHIESLEKIYPSHQRQSDGCQVSAKGNRVVELKQAVKHMYPVTNKQSPDNSSSVDQKQPLGNIQPLDHQPPIDQKQPLGSKQHASYQQSVKYKHPIDQKCYFGNALAADEKQSANVSHAEHKPVVSSKQSDDKETFTTSDRQSIDSMYDSINITQHAIDQKQATGHQQVVKDKQIVINDKQSLDLQKLLGSKTSLGDKAARLRAQKTRPRKDKRANEASNSEIEQDLISRLDTWSLSDAASTSDSSTTSLTSTNSFVTAEPGSQYVLLLSKRQDRSDSDSDVTPTSTTDGKPIADSTTAPTSNSLSNIKLALVSNSTCNKELTLPPNSESDVKLGLNTQHKPDTKHVTVTQINTNHDTASASATTDDLKYDSESGSLAQVDATVIPKAESESLPAAPITSDTTVKHVARLRIKTKAKQPLFQATTDSTPAAPSLRVGAHKRTTILMHLAADDATNEAKATARQGGNDGNCVFPGLGRLKMVRRGAASESSRRVLPSSTLPVIPVTTSAMAAKPLYAAASFIVSSVEKDAAPLSGTEPIARPFVGKKEEEEKAAIPLPVSVPAGASDTMKAAVVAPVPTAAPVPVAVPVSTAAPVIAASSVPVDEAVTNAPHPAIPKFCWADDEFDDEDWDPEAEAREFLSRWKSQRPASEAAVQMRNTRPLEAEQGDLPVCGGVAASERPAATPVTNMSATGLYMAPPRRKLVPAVPFVARRGI